MIFGDMQTNNTSRKCFCIEFSSHLLLLLLLFLEDFPLQLKNAIERDNRDTSHETEYVLQNEQCQNL